MSLKYRNRQTLRWCARAFARDGVRQADVHLRERVAVIGLGLVGQLAGQIVRAADRHVAESTSRRLVARAVADGAADAAFERDASGP